MIIEARKRRKRSPSGAEQPYPGDRIRFTLDREITVEGTVFNEGPGTRDYWTHGDDGRIYLVAFPTDKESKKGITASTSSERTEYAQWRKQILDNLNKHMYAYVVVHDEESDSRIWHVDPKCDYARQGRAVDGVAMSVLGIIRYSKRTESLYHLLQQKYCPTCIALV